MWSSLFFLPPSKCLCLVLLRDAQRRLLNSEPALGVTRSDAPSTLGQLSFYTGHRKPLTLASSSSWLAARPFATLPPRERRCDVGRGSTRVLPRFHRDAALLAQALRKATTPQGSSRNRDGVPPGATVAGVQSLARSCVACKEIFLVLAASAEAVDCQKSPSVSPAEPAEPDMCIKSVVAPWVRARLCQG